MPPPANDYLTFQAWSFQVNAQRGHNQREINAALCGDNPPTLVDGAGKWAVIDRPLRQGVTIPQGFNPAKMKIEIRLGVWDGRFDWQGWDVRPIAGEQVENWCSDLQWMAGYKGIGGPSPIVYCDSYAKSGGRLVRTDLFPRDFRGIGWVIPDGIEWGASLREPQFGHRVYQEATFNLLGYTSLGTPPPPQKTKLAGGYFITRGHARTALSIAAAESSRAPEGLIESLARQICKDHRNNPCRGSRVSLDRRSIHWLMPLGLSVWIPSHAI